MASHDPEHSPPRRAFALAALGGLVLANTAQALTGRSKLPRGGGPLIDIQISGNRVTASISLLGLGLDVTIDFENAQNLTVPSLGLSVALINPLDPALLARLPGGGLVSVPLALPLMISIRPPVAGGLSFTNTALIELHTHLLPFAVGTPLRLFKSPDGGLFTDITEDVLPGSVRTRGRTGGFSDFLIVADLRDHAEVADDRYLFLAARLANPGIAPATRLALETQLATSRSAFDVANYPNASAALLTFESMVRSAAGSAVPNRWRSARDLDNVAGDLLGESSSLRFTLGRLST
jgi:hypothetical protein